MKGIDISVVIPVYGCRAAVKELHKRLINTLKEMKKEYEIILVDDCCPQGSWEEICDVCKEDGHVKGIHLARNFGQMCAIAAGLDTCLGDWIVVMDCDLQDRPEFIPTLYEKALEGYDVVFASRQKRKDGFITKLLSKSFYKVYSYFTGGNFDPSLCNFSISKRIVIENYCRMREHTRAYGMFIKWLGFKQTAIPIEADKRFEGKSSYNFKKKWKMATDIITTQSNKPLMFSVRLGFFMVFCSAIYILYLVLRNLLVGDLQMGWTTIIASIYLVGGVILWAIGISGIYIGNIFAEVKNRPLYVIAEKLNMEGDNVE